ncbi:MAG: DUF2911 domain-containing protein [Bacteroidetes bacterium]|nr:DUF2911 domain-containing protein [Bacteroidota bacterium]
MGAFSRFASAAAVAVLLLVVSPPQTLAQERASELPRLSPSASVAQMIGITEVTVTYGRPSVRGREVFGELVPFDRVWRTGADEATVIQFPDPVTIGGAEIDPGAYALFTVPGAEEWTVILNDEPNQWGAYNYEADRNVHTFTVTPEVAPFRDRMTFTFDDVTSSAATLALHWDELRVPIPLTVDTEALVVAQAEEQIAASSSWQEPLQFAAYALQNETLLSEALQWAQQSIERQENFNNLYVMARVQAALGQYDEAMATGEQALALAENAEDTPVTLDRLRADMERWSEQL